MKTISHPGNKERKKYKKRNTTVITIQRPLCVVTEHDRGAVISTMFLLYVLFFT